MERDVPTGQMDPGTAVLVAVPSLLPEQDALCGDLLAGGDPSERCVALVTLSEDPDRRLRTWTRHAGGRSPRAMAILAPGGSPRSGGGHALDAGPSTDSVRVEPVSVPPNLTDLGLRLTSIVSDWAEGDGRVAVCFDSLSVLLQYVDERRAFQFLTLLLGKLEAIDAVTHVHVDPDAHDDATVATFLSLFDAEYRLSDAGEWAVRRR